MINFFKQLFVWWNQQTIGTFIYTIFRGKFVGKDDSGNKYYESSYGKRWVIYKDEVEATKIPPDWYLWIHFLKDKIPDSNIQYYSWQKKHTANLTGTDKAYKPKGAIMSNKIEKKKYETWKI